jgi:hypothetical protein
MSSTSDAGHGPNGNDKSQSRAIARSVFLAGGLLTAAWFLALILLLRWLIVTVF